MAFYGYKGDVGECHWTPYNTNSFDQFSVLPPESPIAYSAYEFNEPGLTDYTPYSYFDSYLPIQSVQNYYTCNLSEPRLIQCDPPPSYAVSSFYCQTNHIICDSNIEFNEPEFDEYDPTPYGGGYDQIQTYGKPLPPSDEICYPPSSLQPKPNGKLLDGCIPAAYGGKNEQPKKPDGGSKPPSDEICYPPSSPQPKPDGKLLDGCIPAANGGKNKQPMKPDGGIKPPSDEICYPSSPQPKPDGKLLNGCIPAANGGKKKQPKKPDGGSKSPSDEICHPPSSPQPKPDGKLLDCSIPAAYGEKNEKPTKPDGESKPTATKEQECHEEKIAEGTDCGRIGSPKKPLMEEGCHDVDEHPSFDYVGTGGYGYEWNRQVPYVPYGSGLESLDLCESIFGYWPCLAKLERQKKVKCNCSQVGDDEDSRHDPWKSAADYLFGTPFVYSEVQNGGGGSCCPHHDSYTQRNC